MIVNITFHLEFAHAALMERLGSVSGNDELRFEVTKSQLLTGRMKNQGLQIIPHPPSDESNKEWQLMNKLGRDLWVWHWNNYCSCGRSSDKIFTKREMCIFPMNSRRRLTRKMRLLYQHLKSNMKEREKNLCFSSIISVSLSHDALVEQGNKLFFSEKEYGRCFVQVKYSIASSPVHSLARLWSKGKSDGSSTIFRKRAGPLAFLSWGKAE